MTYINIFNKNIKAVVILSVLFITSMVGCSNRASVKFDVGDVTINYGSEYSFCNSQYVFYSVNQGGMVDNLYSGVQGTMIRQMDKKCHDIRDIDEGMILGVTSKYVYYLNSKSSSYAIWRCECNGDALPEEIIYIDYDFDEIEVYAPYVVMTNNRSLNKLCVVDMRTGEVLANECYDEIRQCAILDDYIYVSLEHGSLYRERLNGEQKEELLANTTMVETMRYYKDRICLLGKNNITQVYGIYCLENSGRLSEMIGEDAFENVVNEWKQKGYSIGEAESEYFYILEDKIYFSVFQAKSEEDKKTGKDIFLSMPINGGRQVDYEESVTEFVDKMHRKSGYELLTMMNDTVILRGDLEEYEHENQDIAGPPLYMYDLKKDTISKVKLKSYEGEYLLEYFYAKMCLDRNI